MSRPAPAQGDPLDAPGATPGQAGCPVCEATLPVRPVVRGCDRLFGLAGDFAIFECEECGTGVTQPRPTGEELAGYYPNGYPSWRHRRDLIGVVKRSRTQLAARLPPYGRLIRGAPGAILDVGCGRGDLVSAFARRGWRAHGLDISPVAVDSASRRGVDARVGTIEQAPWAPASFDVIVMSHVLEHVHDPVASLRRARELLKPGGTLVVAVPNWGSGVRRLFGPRWAMLDLPRHLQHFTAAALARAAGRAGFARGRIRTSMSAAGLAISLQYALFGRWVLQGFAREVFLAVSMLLYPLTWMVGRMLGGDCIYLVAEPPPTR
jgi:2-polyprenyl-3-methyl-5-hydroxy-6-metoxy-1,4-benzoquinol methylase